MILDLANRTKNEIIIYFTKWLNLLFPPVEHLNSKDLIWTLDITKIISSLEKYFLFNWIYSILYISVLLIFTIIIFNRKTFEN
jgi:hypothetical protein